MDRVKSNLQIIAATISTIYFSLFVYVAFLVIQGFEKHLILLKLSYQFKLLF
jgi:hypothetical protein